MPITLKEQKGNLTVQPPYMATSSGGSGVSSVNGQTGRVVLDIPSKVSELENDLGYLTEHQSLDTLATKEALNNGLAAKQDKLTAGENITIQNNVISASGGSSGGVSGYCFSSSQTFSNTDKEHLQEIYTNKNIHMTIDDDTVVRVFNMGIKRAFATIHCNGNTDTTVKVYTVDVGTDLSITSSNFSLFLNYYLVGSGYSISADLLTSENWTQYISISGNDWNATNDASNSDLYNAKEMIIVYMHSSYIQQNYLRFDYDASGTTLGSRNSVQFLLDNDDVDKVTMSYGGVSVDMSGGTIIKIFYKT